MCCNSCSGPVPILPLGAPRFPRPGRVGIDNGELLARGDQRFELGDGAAALDPLGALFLLTGNPQLL